MSMQKLVFAAAIVLILTIPCSGQEFKVIAHPSVPLNDVSRGDLSQLFLKKITTYAQWGNAQKAVPIDLSPSSRTREAFTRSVHARHVAAVESYWQQQIFSGRGTPPTVLASEGEVISAVARTSGAIAYVSSEAAVGAGVKVVRLSD